MIKTYSQWIVVSVLAFVLLFALAGRWDLPRAWAYWALLSATHLAICVFVYRSNPELLAERVKPGEGAKGWDQRLLKLYQLVCMAVIAVAAFDIGRAHWSDTVPMWLSVVALVLYLSLIHI